MAVLAAYPLTQGFVLLRRCSGLNILLPQDLDLLPALEKLSADTSRYLKFPRYAQILEQLQSLRCYSLYGKTGNYKTVSVTMGLTLVATKRAIAYVRRKVAGIEELWVREQAKSRK